MLINDNNIENLISIYPIPSKGEININSKYNIKEVSIYNINGQLLSTLDERSFMIENPGLYFIKATDIFGNINIKKIIIE